MVYRCSGRTKNPCGGGDMKWGIRWVCILFLGCLMVGAGSAFDLEVVGNMTYGLADVGEDALSIAQDGEGNLAVAGISRSLSPAGNDALLLRIAESAVFQERTIKGSGYGSEFDAILANNGDLVIAGTCANITDGHPVTTDVTVAAFDPEGNEVMNATFGDHTTNETACCIIQTADGGYLVAGYAENLSTGRCDGLVVKIDASATEEWKRTFGGERDDMVYSAIEDANGDILVAGSTESFGRGEADGWVVRMTASGQEIWNRAYGGIKADAAHALTSTPEGTFAFAGITTYITGSERVDTDAWLVKFDSSGKTLLDVTYGGAEMNASAESFVLTPDGGYLLAGSIEEYGSGNLDAWLVKVDATGNDVWDERFGSVDDDVAHALIALSESYYAFCGTFGAGSDQVPDAWVVWLGEPTPAPSATEEIEVSPTAEPDERTEGDRNGAERGEEIASVEEPSHEDAGKNDTKEDIDREGDDSEWDEDEDKNVDREGDDTEWNEDEEKDDDKKGDDSERDGDEEKDKDQKEETDERDRE
jgi:serine-aspartate repeat-containing protein C/D/E